MQTCAGCAFSAGTAVVLYLTGRVITWWANRARAQAMARVERELA
jgi:hypothetical protein